MVNGQNNIVLGEINQVGGLFNKIEGKNNFVRGNGNTIVNDISPEALLEIQERVRRHMGC